jgi:hypothetical protein
MGGIFKETVRICLVRRRLIFMQGLALHDATTERGSSFCADRRRDVHPQSRLFALHHRPLKRSPNSIVLLEIVSDDLPIAHACDVRPAGLNAITRN